MTETPTYPQGSPIWIDVSSPDIDASKTFYSQLFGWEAETAPMPEAGGYTMFRHDGKLVGALGPVFGPNAHPAWATYFASDNADATAQAVGSAGGRVVMPPMDVMDAGRMAIFQDPTGAFFGIWQPGTNRGMELTEVPISLCWTELHTRDVEAAKRFYAAVFGWGTGEMPMNDGTYTLWKVGDKDIGGGFDITSTEPAAVPAHWLVYFAVENCDATVARAQELGAQVTVPAMDIPVGRMAVLNDPHGAIFAVLQGA